MQLQLVFVDFKKKKTDSECGSCEIYFQLADKKEKSMTWLKFGNKLESNYLCSLDKDDLSSSGA